MNKMVHTYNINILAVDDNLPSLVASFTATSIPVWRMDKRHFERFRCDVSIKIIDHTDNEHIAEACDISEQGICLLLPRVSVMNLTDAGSRLESGNGMKIILPDYADEQPLSLLCSIAHASAVLNGQYIIGLHFEDDSPDAVNFVQRQVNNYKSPAAKD